jgi:hypothetical protein
MRGPVVTRAPAGITLRELAVLRWTGEQYGLPMEVVAELVARDAAVSALSASRVARRVAERLAELGYAGRPRALGRWWLVPTRAGLRAAGLEFRAWDITAHEWSLPHLTMCARLRLHLEAAYPTATWESDRAIRHRWHGSGARVRLTDGGLHWSDDASATGVELERYVKKPSRYRGAVLDTDPAWNAGVWWFTPAGQVDLLTKRLVDAGGGELHQVYPLPEGVRW